MDVGVEPKQAGRVIGRDLDGVVDGAKGDIHVGMPGAVAGMA